MISTYEQLEVAREAYHKVRDVLVIADKLAEQDLSAYQTLSFGTGDKTYLDRGRRRVLDVKEAYGFLDTLFGFLPKKAKKASGVGLSQTELTIVRLLCRLGLNKSIAHEMGITEATVKVHIKTILRKTDMFNRTLLAVWAVRNGLDL